jgi:hypothetical protein
MLTPDDRDAIDQLFERLADLERRGAPRDREAEALIERRLREQRGAAYYLAQTVVVQERALQEAADRIAALERQGGERRGPGGIDQRRRGPWDRDVPAGGGFGGGFLAGAMQTALGVTGGVLLGSMLGGLFGGSANAAEGEQNDADSQQDAGTADDAGGDDGGFDGGDFDVGGDF